MPISVYHFSNAWSASLLISSMANPGGCFMNTLSVWGKRLFMYAFLTSNDVKIRRLAAASAIATRNVSAVTTLLYVSK